MLHDTSRDSAADELYPDKMTEAELRAIRGRRIAAAMREYYKSWNARYSVAAANSPVRGPTFASR